MRLCVGRRRVAPAPAEKKIRPGEPLPRGELLLLACELTPAPRYFPANPPKKPPPPFPSRRSMSRAASVASVHAAPPDSAPPSLSPVSTAFPLPNGRSPGRRGEKRPRRPEDDDRRRRKAGKIVPEPSSGAAEDPEAVFGRATSVAPSQSQAERPLSQRTVDNKAVSFAGSCQADDR